MTHNNLWGGVLIFELQINTVDGTEVGRVTKKWSGFEKEAFTDADNFGVFQWTLISNVKPHCSLLFFSL